MDIKYGPKIAPIIKKVNLFFTSSKEIYFNSSENKTQFKLSFQHIAIVDCYSLREKCPYTDQKKLRIWALFTQ